MDHNKDLALPLLDSGLETQSVQWHSQTSEYKQTPRSRMNWQSFFPIAFLSIIIMGWTSLNVWYSRYESKSPFALVDRGNCGWSIEEAKANDCVYDIMMSSWMPRPCYDEELSESFLKANNFTYWINNDGTGEVSEEEVRKGEFNILFTHGTYHSQHCIYLWKLQMKAQKSSVRVLDSISRSQAHIAHCQKLLAIDLSEHHLWQLKSKAGTPIHVKPQMQSCWEG